MDQDGVTKRFKNGIRADLYSQYLQLAKKIPLPQTAKDGTYKKYTQRQTQAFLQACSAFEALIDIDIERHELSKDYDLSSESLEVRDENGVRSRSRLAGTLEFAFACTFCTSRLSPFEAEGFSSQVAGTGSIDPPGFRF